MARHTFRHFKALMRKNLINWKRQPVCAFFEIFSPIILMVILTLIRWKIPYTRVDAKGMLDQQMTSMYGVGRLDGEYVTTTHGNKY